MALSSFGKILTVLDLFSVERPIINVDVISQELGLSTPTSYRYLKELVSAELLQRLSGTSGDYTLGSKIAILDYISRRTDPLIQISEPYIQHMVERTELSCVLSQINHQHCIDVYHHLYKDVQLSSYGRGAPRPITTGSSAKVILAHLSKQKMLDYYQRFQTDYRITDFAHDESEFIQKMRKVKKQGFYFSNGELDPHISGLSVPIHFSAKEAPIALTLLGSKNRFEFIDQHKLVNMMQDSARQIEQQVLASSQADQASIVLK